MTVSTLQKEIKVQGCEIITGWGIQLHSGEKRCSREMTTKNRAPVIHSDMNTSISAYESHLHQQEPRDKAAA